MMQPHGFVGLQVLPNEMNIHYWLYAEGDEAGDDNESRFSPSAPAWCPAEDQPWIVPDLAATFDPPTAALWHYFVALTGHTYR